MDNLVIENKGDQMVLKLNKKGFDENYLIALVKRLQIESLAQKSGFNSSILNISEEINQDWWNENSEEFLKEVKRWFLISEIYKHKDKLIKHSKLTESEFYLYFNGIIELIKFIPTDFIGLESRQKAYDLCHDVDIKDTPFLALSIELAIPLWTGDKKLKEGLRKKGFQNFYEH